MILGSGTQNNYKSTQGAVEQGNGNSPEAINLMNQNVQNSPYRGLMMPPGSQNLSQQEKMLMEKAMHLEMLQRQVV